MKLKQKIDSTLALAKIKILGRSIPLAVRWQLTNKCPSRCAYCSLWKTPSSELTTNQIFSIINELADMGTKRISFSGGEPTLRKDLGKIINYAVGKGISASINTNGFGLAKKIKELRNIDLIKISLDGPKEIAAQSRGVDQAYDWAIKAAEAAKKAKIRFTFATTLTKYNKNSLQFMVDLARKYGTMVAFQPLKTIYRGAEYDHNLYPNKKEWQKIIKSLRKLKNRYPNQIRNSRLLIDHTETWPKYKKIKCWAGKVFCIIDTNGDLVPCDRVDYPISKKPNCLELGFKKAFQKMPAFNCSGCGFCGAMDLNFLLSFKPKGIYEISQLLD